MMHISDVQITNLLSACQATRIDLPCIKNGAGVLQLYDFAQENLELDITLMVLLFFLFHILGYFFLTRKL